MAGNNGKYSPEYREEISQLIISSGRSATSMAEEMEIFEKAQNHNLMACLNVDIISPTDLSPTMRQA